VVAVIDFFDRGWAGAPDAAAFIAGDETWSYDRAGRLSCRIANALLAPGGFPGTKVAVLAPNSPTAWICVLGIWRAGGVWVPLHPDNPADDNARLMQRFDVDLLFYAPELAEQVESIRSQTRTLDLVALGGAPNSDPVLSDWLADASELRPEVPYEMDDTVMIASTGGTTGEPKGVMNTHRSMSAMVAHQLLALRYDAGDDIVNLAAAPMTHTAGILTLQTSARGGTVVILPRAAVEEILTAIEKHGVTELFLPPTVVYRLLAAHQERPRDTSSLRYLLYGAAPMSVEKLRQGIAALGPVFTEGYGQMEAPAAISFLTPAEHLEGGEPATDARLSSCGRPFPLVTITVRDVDTDAALPAGETGEICVRGDLVMKGYYKAPEQTAEALRDGWLRTGDLGHLDADGYLHLTDRKKDVIISGGFNVYPSQVEQVIWSHPAVEDCVVVGAPDDDWGERVVAVVELHPGDSATAEELLASCRAALGAVRTPKELRFVDRLPRSVNGKVLKSEVRAEFWAGLNRAI